MKVQVSLPVLFAWSCLLPQIASAEPSEVIELWPSGLPADAEAVDPQRAEELSSQTTEERIHYVDRPTISVYRPPTDKANGCAVVVCPGGGYNILAWPKEGVEVAEWLNSIGVTAFVLKYRVPRRQPDKIHWEPLQDIQRAVRVVRHRANQWDVDPERIGTLGFSAGGHLTVMSGVRFDEKTYDPVDQADQVNCRPDFICPIYPAYLGKDYDDKQQIELGPLVTVTKQTPPTFMAVTWDDALRGAQAALLLARLKQFDVPAELHVYSQGGHGYGIRPSEKPVSRWHHQLAAWMKVSGLLEPSQP